MKSIFLFHRRRSINIFFFFFFSCVTQYEILCFFKADVERRRFVYSTPIPFVFHCQTLITNFLCVKFSRKSKYELFLFLFIAFEIYKKNLIFHYCFPLFVRFIWKLFFPFRAIFYAPPSMGQRRWRWYKGEEDGEVSCAFDLQLITIDVHVLTEEVSETEMLRVDEHLNIKM